MPAENEHYNAIGDSNQQTTGGLLAWRKADNWTAFTDGYRTWINGPNGLEQRLNTERFEWEQDPPAPAPEPTPVPTPAPVAVECPDGDTVRGLVSESLQMSGMRGDLLKKWMYQLSVGIDSVEWACAWFYYLGYGPDNKWVFVNSYVTDQAYRTDEVHHLSALEQSQSTGITLFSPVLSVTTSASFSFDRCQVTASVQPTPRPQSTPTPTPRPTPYLRSTSIPRWLEESVTAHRVRQGTAPSAA